MLKVCARNRSRAQRILARIALADTSEFSSVRLCSTAAVRATSSQAGDASADITDSILKQAERTPLRHSTRDVSRQLRSNQYDQGRGQNFGGGAVGGGFAQSGRFRRLQPHLSFPRKKTVNTAMTALQHRIEQANFGVPKKLFYQVLDFLKAEHAKPEARFDLNFKHTMVLFKAAGWYLITAGRQERVQAVQDVIELMKLYDMPLQVPHHNTIMSLYIANSHKFDPAVMLAEIEKSGYEPSSVTLQRVVDAYCHQGEMSKAMLVRVE